MTVLFGCLITPSYGADVTLQWDANVESDLLGYNIYYKAGSSGPPYNGSGALEGESPIEVNADDVTIGNVSEFALTGLDNTQTYYFAVTAYNEGGFESGYSNEICFNYLPDEPVIHDVVPYSTPASRYGNPQFVDIRGLNFGQTQCTSTLHVGPRVWSAGHPKIKLWSDDEIRFKVPKYKYVRSFPKLKAVWVTVNGTDSDRIWLEITAP